MREIDTRPEKLAWIAAFLGGVALTGAISLGQVAKCTTLIPTSISSIVWILVSLTAVARARFARHQREEEAGVADFRALHEGAELFAESDEAVKIAARANQSFIKYFVPTFTAILSLGILAATVVFWRSWNATLTFPVASHPLRYSALSFTLFLACIIAGSYFIGASRENLCRWLRPAGAWMFFTGLLFLFGFISLISEHYAIAIQTFDVRMAKIAMTLLGILATETLLGFVIEFYRPRTYGEKERPLYESRLLALFTEPGGLARNIALSLDYQFGFQVSEAWFYRFLERSLIPLLMTMMIGLWILTCFVVVKTEENGIRERFGGVVSETPLEPGLYVKLPWPLAKIYTFPVQRVQEIPIGYKPGNGNDTHSPESGEEELIGDLTGRVIVWSKKHHKEELNFVVASQQTDTLERSADDSATLPVAVHFMSASIPLYFKVSNLYSYAYLHENPRKTLEEIATREVVHYLANIDFVNILTKGRAAGGEALRKRIQQAANELDLGIDIVFVGLQGLHPPVKVGDAYDEVVGAMEEKHAEALKAEQYAVRKEPEAEAAGIQLTTAAKAYSLDRIRVAAAEKERFSKQLLGYQASPDVFVLRSFLDVLETEGQNVRKYVVTADKSSEVFVINLEKKLRPDLLDLDITKDQ